MKFVRVCTLVSKNLLSHIFPTVFLRSYFVGKKASPQAARQPERGCSERKPALPRLGQMAKLLPRRLICYLGRAVGAAVEERL